MIQRQLCTNLRRTNTGLVSTNNNFKDKNKISGNRKVAELIQIDCIQCLQCNKNWDAKLFCVYSSPPVLQYTRSGVSLRKRFTKVFSSSSSSFQSLEPSSSYTHFGLTQTDLTKRKIFLFLLLLPPILRTLFLIHFGLR